MNNKFDELAKALAQSVTRRGALKKFGAGLAGMALACFGLAKRAEAAQQGGCLPRGTLCVLHPKTIAEKGLNCNHCCSKVYFCGFGCSCQ